MRDTVVIGGGVLGQLTALALADRGRRVRLLDAGLPPASWAGGGILSALFPWRYPDALTALTFQALPAYQALAARIMNAGAKDPEAHKTGLLIHAETEIEQAIAWAASWQIQVMPGESSGLPSILRSPGALWFPDIGTIRNPRLLKGLSHLLRQSGVIIERSVHVSALRRSGSAWRLQTSRGEYQTEQVLLAAGAWSTALLASLGVTLPLRPVQGEMLLYDTGSPAPPCVVLTDEGYVIPRADGQTVVGSTMREAGFDQRPTEEAYVALRKVGERLWPPLRSREPVAQWAGLRPGSNRPWPWLSEVPSAPGLFVAVGHHRNGLVSAPASAYLLAALMCDQRPPFDPEPYRLF